MVLGEQTRLSQAGEERASASMLVFYIYVSLLMQAHLNPTACEYVYLLYIIGGGRAILGHIVLRYLGLTLLR